MIRHLDAWIGRRLFHPPIIWICQRAGLTQYALHRYIWWSIALWVVWRNDWASWVWSAFVILFALTRTISAAINPDRQRPGALWFRVVIWAVLALSAFPGDRQSMAISIAQLVAEYAITIMTIPPPKRSERKPAGAESLI